MYFKLYFNMKAKTKSISTIMAKSITQIVPRVYAYVAPAQERATRPGVERTHVRIVKETLKISHVTHAIKV